MRCLDCGNDAGRGWTCPSAHRTLCAACQARRALEHTLRTPTEAERAKWRAAYYRRKERKVAQ